MADHMQHTMLGADRVPSNVSPLSLLTEHLIRPKMAIQWSISARFLPMYEACKHIFAHAGRQIHPLT